VYSYGYEKQGDSEFQLVGSYRIKDAEVEILEKWF
jgi:hypothetical protein